MLVPKKLSSEDGDGRQTQKTSTRSFINWHGLGLLKSQKFLVSVKCLPYTLHCPRWSGTYHNAGLWGQKEKKAHEFCNVIVYSFVIKVLLIIFLRCYWFLNSYPHNFQDYFYYFFCILHRPGGQYNRYWEEINYVRILRNNTSLMKVWNL